VLTLGRTLPPAENRRELPFVIARQPALRPGGIRRVSKLQLKTIRGAKAGHTQSALTDYHDFRDMLDEQLALFADMNTFSQGVHLDTDFAEIIERIKGQAAGASLRVLEGETPGPTRVEPQADAKWEARLEQEIISVLARAHKFRRKMAEKLGLDQASDALAVARGLLSRHTQEVNEQVLVPGTRELLRECDGLSSAKARTLWHEAKCLSIINLYSSWR
jgi:hypothetical protein